MSGRGVSIRRRGTRQFQVRVSPFPARTFPTAEAAKRCELELLLRRSEGDRYVEKPQTLGREIEAWLLRKRSLSAVRPPTMRYYERSARVWDVLAAVRVSSLRRDQVEDFIAARAAEHRRSAKNELEFLKRVLRDARGRGQRVDEAIFAIEPIRHVPREGRALSVDQLYELASWFPDGSRRLVLLAGMIGARQRVWFEMTDDLLDLANARLAIPAWLSKNGKPHHVYLTGIEAQLFREQLMVRAGGTALVFPSPTGKQWTESGFRQRVWEKGVSAAVANDVVGVGRQSVFEHFNFHLLRHTACSLMAMAGMDPSVAAERASHTDGGALFLRKYRHLYEGEKRVQAMRLEALVRASLDGTWTADPAEPLTPLDLAEEEDGRGWDRTSDPSRVKRVLSR
jgi:integrase